MNRTTVFHAIANKAKFDRGDDNVINEILKSNNLSWPAWTDTMTVTVIRESSGKIVMTLTIDRAGLPGYAVACDIPREASIPLLRTKLYMLYKTVERKLTVGSEA